MAARGCAANLAEGSSTPKQVAAVEQMDPFYHAAASTGGKGLVCAGRDKTEAR